MKSCRIILNQTLTFPLIVLLIGRFERIRTIAIAAALLVSFVIFLWLSQRSYQAAFYFMPARAWELLAGALLASLLADGARPPVRGQAAAMTGLFLMITPAFLQDASGLWLTTLLQTVCVLGTVCLLSANLNDPSGPVSIILSAKPFRFVGLISYSLYLIHWPVITLYKYWAIKQISTPERIGLLAVSVILAWASWRWIEVPLRTLANARSTRLSRMFLGAGLTIALLVVATWTVKETAGLPGRFESSYRVWLSGAADVSPNRKRCHSDEESRPIAPRAACVLGPAGARADLAVWADSHGVELAQALAERLAFEHRAVAQFTSSSCPPIISSQPDYKQGCRAYNEQVLDVIGVSSNISIVVLTLNHRGYPQIGDAEQLSGLEQTIKLLQRAGKKVVVIGPAPRPEYNVPAGFARQAVFGGSHVPDGLALSAHRTMSGARMEEVLRLSKVNGAISVDPVKSLCAGQTCPYAQRGRLLYFDDNHLTMSGARLVADAIMREIGPTVEQ